MHFFSSARYSVEKIQNEYSKTWEFTDNGIYTTPIGGSFAYGSTVSRDSVTAWKSGTPVSGTSYRLPWNGKNGAIKIGEWNGFSCTQKGSLWVGASSRIHEYQFQKANVVFSNGMKITRD